MLFAVFIFLLLIVHYSNAMPHAKQTLKKTLKKKIRCIYEKHTACTSVYCNNDFNSLREWVQPLITLIKNIRENLWHSWQNKKLRSTFNSLRELRFATDAQINTDKKCN